jgi:RNA polymerase sigma-70 factor (ECF subfamily)
VIDSAPSGNNEADAPDSTMGELVATVAASLPGEPAEFESAPDSRARALVLAHFDFIWRLLRRLGVPAADLDDAAQQVFVVASQRLSRIPEGRERTFLFGTAVRTAGTVRRNLRRRQRWVETSPADAPSLEPTPEEELERRQALAFLDEVLDGLPDDLRVVFVLCEIEELTAAEVAGVEQIPVGTVASRLRRARKEFAERLRRLQAQRVREP